MLRNTTHTIRIRTDSAMVTDRNQILQDECSRMHQLGVSGTRVSIYYKQLSGPREDRDWEQDIRRAFSTAIDGLNLSQEDETFVKTTLESGNGR